MQGYMIPRMKKMRGFLILWLKCSLLWHKRGKRGKVVALRSCRRCYLIWRKNSNHLHLHGFVDQLKSLGTQRGQNGICMKPQVVESHHFYSSSKQQMKLNPFELGKTSHKLSEWGLDLQFCGMGWCFREPAG